MSATHDKGGALPPEHATVIDISKEVVRDRTKFPGNRLLLASERHGGRTMTRGTLTTVSWAGPHAWSVDVLDETPKRFRIRTRTKACLPSRGWVPKGTIVLVPKDAITLRQP